ncbi:hypothetical protein [uncultured Draconibacterium sp.]|uniref:hypothetical protein n=1 Tax=uncultured Draconibacterium sp. TaxID=1573823 RepID=UPI0032170AF3
MTKTNCFVIGLIPKTKCLKTVFILFIFFVQAFFSGAQEKESTKVLFFDGNISATNNGISLIPSFSLGKPALVFEFSMGGERLHFDPQLRFSMKAKPWSFVFWWRYKLYETQKFRMDIGAHPAFLFADISYQKDGRSFESIETRRYLAAEIAPTFQLTEKIAIKPYYLTAHGFDEGVSNSHYLSLRGSVSNLRITKHVEAGFTPQVFFLKMDQETGYYFASGFSLKSDKTPFSLGAMINKKIESEIASKDFLWNVSLVYSFGNEYVKK